MYKYLVISLLISVVYFSYSKIFEVKVAYGNQFYSPIYLEINEGDTVRFVNYGLKNQIEFTPEFTDLKNDVLDFKYYKDNQLVIFGLIGICEYYNKNKTQKGVIKVKAKYKLQSPYAEQSAKKDVLEFYIGDRINDEVDLKIYNVVGKLIIDKKTNLINGKGFFDTKMLSKGIYFLKIYRDFKQVFFYKFVKD